MADISNINLPNGENYDIKDKVARNDIAINRTTLGVQCKNLLDVRNYASKYTAGVTASPNGVDGLTFSGTANNTFYLAWNDKAFSLKKGDYILSYAGDITSDKPNNTFLRVRKSDNTIICDLPLSQTSKSFSLNVDDELYFIAVYTNVTANVQGTIKPMIRYADITDDTYEPYKESVDERLIKNKSDIAINKSTLGYQCKNLLKNTAVSTSYSDVKFTVNSDGTVDVSSIKTSTATRFLVINSLILNEGQYILTGGDNLGNYGDVRAYVDDVVYKHNEAFTLTEAKTVVVRICIYTNKTLPNVINVNPMIRYADITDSTYEQYQPSVQEQLSELEARIAALEG